MANRGFLEGGGVGKHLAPCLWWSVTLSVVLWWFFSDGVFIFKPRRRIFVSSLKKIVKKEKNIHFCFISKVDVEPRTVRYQFWLATAVKHGKFIHSTALSSSQCLTFFRINPTYNIRKMVNALTKRTILCSSVIPRSTKCKCDRIFLQFNEYRYRIPGAEVVTRKK